MKYFTFLSFTLLFSLLSCDDYSQDDYREYVVVEAYAVANRTMPVVRVSHTVPAGEEYVFEETAINNAIVQVVLLDANGDDEEIYPYNTSTVLPGAYISVDSAAEVLPRRRYRLDVAFNDRSEVIEATTRIPDDFSIINAVQDSVVYQSDEQLQIVLSATEQHGDQNVFVFNALSLEPDTNNLTPFYKSTVEDGDSELGDFTNNSSGLINEGNFDLNPNGTITLNFPWIGVAFYGDNLIVTNSVDKNISDLIRSQDVQLGGSTLSPGEIPNVTYNVEGGIGVFGSFASDTIKTHFKRQF